MAKSGEEVPALVNRPTLTTWQKYFWEAYHTLTGSRTFHSAGISYIPISEIFSYLDGYYIFDLELRNLYVKHIQSLDNLYVENASKKN